MGLLSRLAAWFATDTPGDCPVCGLPAARHLQRTLARERFAPGRSGIEALLARGDYAGAARLDDPSAMGDLLVHRLLRCGKGVARISFADPLGVDLDPRVREVAVLPADTAELAWRCARRA